MNRCFMVTALLLVLCTGNTRAQLVPLELDQTITLPQGSAIWDVMPHPDGYYLWVQAVTQDTTQTRIYWARTDSARVDSFSVAVGAPQATVCFWSAGSLPAVVVSRRGRLAENPLYVQAFRLTDGQPISPSMEWWHLPLSNTYSYYTNYQLALAVPLPPPPDVSTSVAAFVSWHLRMESEYDGINYSSDDDPTEVYRDLLLGSSSLASTFQSTNLHTWCWDGDVVHFGYAGTSSSSWYGQGGGDYWMGQFSGMVDFTGDSIRSPWYRECPPDTGTHVCFSAPIQCMEAAGRIVLAGALSSQAIGAVDSTGELWRVTGGCDIALAAELIGSNSAEEFLCYDSTRHLFDVLGATDGHNYGVTDTITIPGDGGARIIGRYDSTSRRLAFRVGNQLKLYRFGEYLAAGNRDFIPHPSSLILSSFPNPFNPTTQIAFRLPRAQRVNLTVYDVTGRTVRVLTDQVCEAGEHLVNFDGSGLPSGIYFARLSAGTISKTEKLLLLK